MGTNLSKGRNREWLQRDVDRERRLRLDTEARLKGSSSEADRCRAKLSALQKDFTKMEETVRTLLQYKSKFEQLKQDRHSVANSYENQILQLQNAITKLKIENETLKKQINTLEATGISQVQKALVERLRILEHEKNRIEREGEQQRKQYERCLDEVAKQVVKAVLSQKGLREEISSLQHRVKELETGNCALSALLVQRLGQKISYSPTTMPVVESRSVMFDIHRSPSMKMAIERPASCDLTKGLKKLKNDGSWQTAVSYHRPQSLNLEICCSHNAEESTKCDRVLGDETPESGNRDEGYSTMSSDVQGTAEPPSAKGLEDVKEANENESTALTESSPCSRAPNSEDTDVIFVPLGLSFSFINPRHSYPPLRCLSTVPARHVMRSYSDSHLFLRLTATAASGGVGEDEDGTSWYSGGELWDIDYVQHWLRLDETRAAIQQRMEYDAAELEDWTMADDGAVWRRTTVTAATEDGRQRSLPCIEEDDGTSTAGGGGDDDDDDDDPWHLHFHHHRHRRPQHQHRNAHRTAAAAAPRPSASSSSPPPSSASSWSSADEYAAADTPPSRKRSSASSCCSDSPDPLLLPPPDRPIAGTDFTRDFYRLVKFESSKSLASCASSRGECWPRAASDAPQQPDREQALQTVLDFIAEQQQYCLSRQAEIKPVPAAAAAEDVDEATDLHRPSSPCDGSTARPPPLPPPSSPPPLHRQRTCDSNSCSDNLLNSKDSGLWGSDVEIECLPEDGNYDEHRCGGSGTAVSTPRSTLLRTVPEEEDDDDDDAPPPTSPAASTSPQPPSTGAGRSSSACTADTAIATAAWTATSSKDLIDQLNRLAGVRSPAAADRDGPDVEPRVLRRHSAASLDEACCCPTGWVHVERDIDFADPKERANLLDVMLASSRSSSSSSGATADDDEDGSRSGAGASFGSVGEEPDDGGGHDTADDVDSDCSLHDDARDPRPTVGPPVPTGSRAACAEESYNRLHKLHRVRRQKKASAVRDGFGVLRAPTAGLRQSIVGRSDFFVRFGDKEREAMANFDFLDDLSATSPGSADSACDRPPSPPAARGSKCYLYTCSPQPSTSGRRPRTSSPLLPRDARRQRRRRYSGLSLSDSCGDSD